jgi:hypothetical protein
MCKGSLRIARIGMWIVLFIFQIINAKDYEKLFARYP